MATLKRVECIIKGRVQMVMFRDFVQRKANRLGIFGYVKNLPDGSVFVVAEGREDSLSDLIAILRKGPLLACVDSVKVKWIEQGSEFNNFKIEY